MEPFSTSTIAARRFVPPRSQPMYFFMIDSLINSPHPINGRGVRKRRNQILMDVWLKDIARKIKASLDQLLIAFEVAVFMLDANHIIVARRRERGKEFLPVHITETRQARHLPAHALGEHTMVV